MWGGVGQHTCRPDMFLKQHGHNATNTKENCTCGLPPAETATNKLQTANDQLSHTTCHTPSSHSLPPSLPHLHSLPQHVICLAEGVIEAGAPVCHVEQLVVGDDDEAVDTLLQRTDALEGLGGAAPPLKAEGVGHNSNSEDACWVGVCVVGREGGRGFDGWQQQQHKVQQHRGNTVCHVRASHGAHSLEQLSEC